MKIEDRLLFLKYALPCAGTLVKRGAITQDYLDDLVHTVSEGKVPAEDAESIFKVANAMCTKIGERMNKASIDAEVIRTYFLLEHSAVVDDRYALMKDFDPVSCRTYARTIVEAGKDYAIIETGSGRKKYRTDFAKSVREGDCVIVHWNFVVEKVPETFSERMSKAVP